MPSSPPVQDPDDPWGGADPNAPDFKDRLHERYHVLRARFPVHKTPRGMWRLTRYDDCQALLKRTSVGVRTTEGVLPYADESKRKRAFMLDQDPPTHTRLRALVRHAFTPAALEKLEGRIEQTTDALLDEVRGRDRFDLVQSLALPLPSAIICEMMGVPLEDRPKFLGWTTDMTYFLLGVFASDEQKARSDAGIAALETYLQRLIDEARRSPRDDLLTRMARAEEAGDRLTNDELIWQSMGLLLAGFETTTGLIANGVRQLLLHPSELARLRDNPSLIEAAVEECLRFDGPTLGTARVLHEDAEFSGHTIGKGEKVMAILAAANRDPERFADPDRFDIGRSPNPHLAFGGGIHFCLGAHLARLEGQAAIGRLFQRYTRLRLESDTVTWGRSLFRIPGELWLRVE